MKSYGKVKYVRAKYGSLWMILAQPNVLMRAKAVFGRVDKNDLGGVRFLATPEASNDLEWFLKRYPMEVEEPRVLAVKAELHRTQLEALEMAVQPDYVPTERKLRHPLRDYQARMVDIFLQSGRLLCADTLGLGKTVEAIGALTDPRMLPALVVCKPHLQTQWKSMAEEFIDGIKVEIISSRTITKFDPVPDVLIISYSKLSAWAEDLRTLVKSMILDEIQEMRRYESEKTRAANSLRRHLKFCLGLSATPIYNYGGEIYNIINLIAPKVLGTQDEFHREWCDGYGDKCCLRDPDAFGAYLREQFLMVRRTRAEVGRELPPKMSLVQRIDYDPKVLDAVQDATFQLAKMVLEGGFHESGMAARELDAKARQATGVAKAPFVITFCRLLLDEGPIILTGWHREVYEIWKYQLDLHSIPYCMYTGSETAKEKDTAKKAFISGKAKLMILSLRSGEGLDGLQTASSTIVHGELDWSPGVMEQCSGRLFRDGQVKNVTEIFLVSDGGSDPVLSGMLGLKKVQLTGILEPGQEKGLKKLQVDANRIKKLAQYYVDNRFGGKGADPDASDDEPIQSPSDSALTAISSQTKHPITENK